MKIKILPKNLLSFKFLSKSFLWGRGGWGGNFQNKKSLKKVNVCIVVNTKMEFSQN